MKNQYFGDINDYQKYGLIRALTSEAGMKFMVAWMLTPGDGRTDGKFTEYLDDPAEWRLFDPTLFDGLSGFLNGTDQRRVSMIESSSLIPRAEYYSPILPDDMAGRRRWFADLLVRCAPFDTVFFDPDNGIEVKSVPKGKKDSSKYVYWDELRETYSLGKSVLVYQHFPRLPRDQFVADHSQRLRQELDTDAVFSFRTDRVVYFLASQPSQQPTLSTANDTIQEKWGSQFVVQEWRNS